jgi:HTH-type transcriptional regulator/antitoxin HipB
MATSRVVRDALVRTPQALGIAIRVARTEQGLTQAELAQRSLTSRQTINALEAGHETRAISVLFDSLAALGLELVVRPRQRDTA